MRREFSDKERFAAVQLARADLYFFSRWLFLQRRGYTWQRARHHRMICDALMRVFTGECTRLIINVPPRYSKTELAVVNFIAWALGHVPDAEFIHVSYAAALAINNSANVRALVQHEAFAEVFPNSTLSSDAKAHWTTTAGGVMYATGAGGTITGFGAGKHRDGFGGAIIIDDPHKPDEARSDVIREGVIDWFQNTLESRKNAPHTPIIVIMQRLHERDLAGWLLGGGNGEVWEHLCLPAENDDGTPLWPEKHSVEDLRRMRESSPYTYAGQYAQAPAPLEGGLVKIGWFGRYDRLPEAWDMVVCSWDTAQKVAQHNDPSAGTIWGIKDNKYYLMEAICKRVEYPALRQEVKNSAARYNAGAVLIEDKASGVSLAQELRRERVPIITVTPLSDKQARMLRASPMIEAGQVLLPRSAPWLAAYEHELAIFPNGNHDDQVDSTSQFLNWAFERAPRAPMNNAQMPRRTVGDSYGGY